MGNRNQKGNTMPRLSAMELLNILENKWYWSPNNKVDVDYTTKEIIVRYRGRGEKEFNSIKELIHKEFGEHLNHPTHNSRVTEIYLKRDVEISVVDQIFDTIRLLYM